MEANMRQYYVKFAKTKNLNNIIDKLFFPKYNWVLNIYALDPDVMSLMQYNSYCGVQPFPGAISYHSFNELVTGHVPYHDASKIESLILPSNWHRISEGCSIDSSKTMAWLENWLGMECKLENSLIESSEIPV